MPENPRCGYRTIIMNKRRGSLSLNLLLQSLSNNRRGMKTLKPKSSLVKLSAGSLTRVYASPEFWQCLGLTRDNSDGTHAQIVAGCTSTPQDFANVVDGMLGLRSLNDFFSAGGKLLPAPSQAA